MYFLVMLRHRRFRIKLRPSKTTAVFHYDTHEISKRNVYCADFCTTICIKQNINLKKPVVRYSARIQKDSCSVWHIIIAMYDIHLKLIFLSQKLCCIDVGIANAMSSSTIRKGSQKTHYNF